MDIFSPAGVAKLLMKDPGKPTIRDVKEGTDKMTMGCSHLQIPSLICVSVVILPLRQTFPVTAAVSRKGG